MKHLLLTGATGFLGSHLLEALLRRGDQVTILKRSTSNTWRIKHLLDDVAAFDVDVQPLEEAFKPQKFDAVIHTACSYGRRGEPAQSVVQTNLLFGLRLLDAATAFNTHTFFNTDTFFNTGTSLPKYLNSYSLSKKQFVEWLKSRSSEIQIINLKLHHVYGPRDDQSKFIPWLIDQFKINAKRIPLTEGSQLRDFIFVDDIVSAYICALDNTDQLDTFSEFDVGTGDTIEVRTFVSQLYQAYKAQNPALASELGFGDIPMHSGELMNVNVDISNLKKLGWLPGENGVLKTIKQAIEND